MNVEQKLGSGHREQLEDGNALLFERNGIFQVRYYKGGRSYIYKSCWRRFNIDHLCRLNFDQGLLPAI